MATRGWRQRVLAFLNTNVGGWFLGTVVVGLVGFSWTQYQDKVTATERQEAAMRAKAQRDTELVTGLLPYLAQPAAPGGALAVELVRHLRSTGGIDAALADMLGTLLGDVARTSVAGAHGEEATPEKRERYLASAEVAAAALDAQPPSDKRALRNLPKRVYIHVPDEVRRAAGASIQAQLRGKGLLVPGIQNVGDKAPAKSEVRYFNDADEKAAADIAKGIGVNATRSRIAAPQGQIEVWLGKR
jgi:hypothetical protein